MARISGIQFKNNAAGKPTHVVIDLRQHGAELEDFLDAKVFEASKEEPTMPFDDFVKELDEFHHVKRTSAKKNVQNPD